MSLALQQCGFVPRFAAVLLCAAGAMGLSGCASVSEKVGTAMSNLPLYGMRSGAPDRPTEIQAYPAVHDMPPPRTTAVLSGTEQVRVEKDLALARDEQKAATTPVATPAVAKQVQAKKRQTQPANAVIPTAAPTSSSKIIY